MCDLQIQNVGIGYDGHMHIYFHCSTKTFYSFLILQLSDVFILHFVIIRKLVDKRNERKSWCHDPMKDMYNLQTCACLFFPPFQIRQCFSNLETIKMWLLQLPEFPLGNSGSPHVLMLDSGIWQCKENRLAKISFLPSVHPSVCAFILLIFLSSYFPPFWLNA